MQANTFNRFVSVKAIDPRSSHVWPTATVVVVAAPAAAIPLLASLQK
jgi:hypothetical protein